MDHDALPPTEDEAPRAVGLPPTREEQWQPPSTQDLWGARLLNTLGLITPVANLGMLQTARPDLRWAGLVAGVLLWGVGAVSKASGTAWLAATAFGLHYALVVAGLVHPRWPEAAFRLWTRFGELLGKVMTVPIFTAMYVVAVTPVALVMRALGKDPLRRRAGPSESYWHERKTLPPERFHRQF